MNSFTDLDHELNDPSLNTDNFIITSDDFPSYIPPELSNYYAERDFEASLSSDISYPTHSTSLAVNTRRAGRVKNEFTKVLERFLTPRNKPPKKEYFNAFSIRAIKRAIKNARRGLIPKRTSIAIDTNSEIQMNMWHQIERLCRQNIPKMEEILKIDLGYANDREHKSFTNRFCKEFYDHAFTREIFTILLNIIYSASHPKNLCDKFKFMCCFSSHTSECEEKWNVLREYLMMSYFLDIEASIKEENEGNENELLELGLKMDFEA